MKDFVAMDHLSTENTTLYWGLTASGDPGLLYFTMADLFSHSVIPFDLSDVRDICEFLNNWGHESLSITQIYTTRRNSVPLRCQVKFEYVDTKDPKIPRSQQVITFYDDYTEEDPEKDEGIQSISSWTDWNNHEKFEKFRDFMNAILQFWEATL